MVATPWNAYAQTKKEDQQRINVAMSRARDRLYLVRSVQLEDLRPTDIKAQILQHFANPMPEGRAVTGGEIDTLLDRCDSGFEREMLQMLLDANYRVRPQVPAGGFRIDLVVEVAEDRRLAIELDRDQFHGPNVWEHDMIRQAALERAGWIFWRVFGSQWRANRDYWWAILRETLERLKIEPIGATEIDDRFTETILVDAWGNGDGASDGPTASASVDLGTPAQAETSTRSSDEPPHLSMTTDTENPSSEPEAQEAANPADEAALPDKTSNRGDLFGLPETARPMPRPLKSASKQQAEFELDGLAPSQTNGIARPAPEQSAQSSDGKRIVVSIGSTVRLEKLGNGGGKMEITLVEDGHDAALGMIGVHTPLGKALLDAEVGDEVEYRAGAYLQEVKVLQVD